jgi:hypothetical protein
MWLSTPPGWGKKKSLTMAILYGIVPDSSLSGFGAQGQMYVILHIVVQAMHPAATVRKINLMFKMGLPTK